MAAEEEMKAPGAAKADTQRLRGLKSSKGVLRLRLQRKIKIKCDTREDGEMVERGWHLGWR